MNPLYLRIVLRVMLLALWAPSLAIAASVITLNQTLGEVTFLVVGVVGVLSTLAGATALILRIDKELRDQPAAALPRPYLFASAHMLGSWLAGALAFITAEAQDMNDWSELGLIVVASFSGARFIEVLAEKYLIKTRNAS
ncbi:hypothetical protein [Polaromonas sp.]|uniref:hypothetical protein n=1 Tax=Polaromonas sp. TaxID=1869339 RepID=UPI003752C2E0